MKHDLAVEKSMTALEKGSDCKELRAALTHWLQFPDSLPPFFTESHKRRVLSEYLPSYMNRMKSKIAANGTHLRRLPVKEAMQLQEYDIAASVQEECYDSIRYL